MKNHEIKNMKNQIKIIQMWLLTLMSFRKCEIKQFQIQLDIL